MSEVSENQILEVLQPRLEMLDLSVSDVDKEASLLEQGILDSMSFLEFVVELESTFGVNLDFSELEPSEFTSINKIQNLINTKTIN